MLNFIIIVIGRFGGCWLGWYIIFIIVFLVLLYKLIDVYKFIVSIIIEFFVNNRNGFKLKRFWGLIFLVVWVECLVWIVVIGWESFFSLV